MTRLLVTGSSHVAAVRLAFERLAALPQGLDVDYLAANAAEFRLFSVNAAGVYGLHDAYLVAESQRELARSFSGGLLRDIADYSHVVIVGCTLNHYRLLRLLTLFRIDDIREKASVLPRLSQAAYRDFSLSIAWQQYPAAILSALTPRVKAAITSAPRFSEAILTDPTSEPHFRTLAADPSGIGAALAVTDRAFGASCARLGVTYIPPPEESLTPDGFSKYDYARNSVHIRVGKPPDHLHMNGDYGALCVRQILDWVGA